jgi:hypothetical protein
MENTQLINRQYGAVAWGLLSILWGITILFDFIPFGFGLVGTGLILLGVNMVRSYNSLPIKDDNTVLGILALAWGGLELARPNLHLLFKIADLDWAIFSILLVVLGVVVIARGLVVSRAQ